MDVNGDIGYFVEVSLHYPPHLHKFHNDFPAAPQSLNIMPHMLSEMQQKHLKDLNLTPKKNIKLCLTLYDKDNYVCHIKNLQLYLQLGLQLKAIHKILKFKQSCFFKEYVELNTSLRANARSKFEKDLAKLYNNALFGKTIGIMNRMSTLNYIFNFFMIILSFNRGLFIEKFYKYL